MAKKICPVLRASALHFTEDASRCQEGKCEIYLEGAQCCSIAAVPKVLEDIAGHLEKLGGAMRNHG